MYLEKLGRLHRTIWTCQTTKTHCVQHIVVFPIENPLKEIKTMMSILWIYICVIIALTCVWFVLFVFQFEIQHDVTNICVFHLKKQRLRDLSMQALHIQWSSWKNSNAHVCKISLREASVAKTKKCKSFTEHNKSSLRKLTRAHFG